MVFPMFVELFRNAALLLALGLLYDMLPLHKQERLPQRSAQQVFTGILLGATAIAVMLTPWMLAPGVVFDTRSVLLAVAGLFFGSIPTVIAILMAAGLRLYQAGDGMWMGVAVIISSGAIGITWRQLRQSRLKTMSARELYGFGVAVHLVMLLCTGFLPRPMAFGVLSQIYLPVLTIYPIAVMLLGMLLVHRLVRKHAIEALRESEERYRTTLLSVGDGVITVNARGQVELLNPVAEALTGWPAAEARGRPLREVFNVIHEVTRQPAEDPAAQALLQGRVVGLANHTQLIARDGSEHPVADSAAPIANEQGEIIGVVLVFRDQTHERASQERFRALFEYSAAPVLEEDFSAVRAFFDHLQAQGVQDFREYFESHPEAVKQCAGLVKVLDANQQSLRFFQADCKTDLVTSLTSYLDSDSWDSFREELISLAGGQPNFFCEITNTTIKGQRKHLSLHLQVVPGCEQSLAQVLVSFWDITERKLAEAALQRAEQQAIQALADNRQALQEKEVLLRELYHRTKNNMQVIRAMLVLQSADSDSEEVQRLVKETDNKIQAMALVHQMLYQSQNLSSIALQTYIHDLAHLALSSYRPAANRISLKLALEPAQVTIDTATPLGLILNELLSNAYKHAFPGDRKGEICISLTGLADGRLRLEFSDNGVGIPPGFELREQKTYGLQTLFSIAELQLGGQVQVNTAQGLAYAIEFSTEQYHQRV